MGDIDRGEKTRDNYPSGGWCGKTDCIFRHRGKRCEKCFKFSEYRLRKK